MRFRTCYVSLFEGLWRLVESDEGFFEGQQGLCSVSWSDQVGVMMGLRFRVADSAYVEVVLGLLE